MSFSGNTRGRQVSEQPIKLERTPRYLSPIQAQARQVLLPLAKQPLAKQPLASPPMLRVSPTVFKPLYEPPVLRVSPSVFKPLYEPPPILRQYVPMPSKLPSSLKAKTPLRTPKLPQEAVPQQAQPNINALKISAAELYVMDSYSDATESMLNDSLIPKFKSFRQIYPANHKIDVTKYDNVYITSDTHADFRKLVQMLNLADLILVPTKDVASSVEPIKLDPYSDDIYNPKLILNTQWLVPRTLFVIAGDLVDGRRCAPGEDHLCEVQDPRGSFELLIFAFLYNLRIEANKIGSEILFTLGNHDFNSVILTDSTEFCENYVHSSTYNFYAKPTTREKLEQRKRLLTPFYENSPYYFLSLENPNGTKEVGIIHASLHADDESSLLDSVISQQTEIDSGNRKLHEFFTDKCNNPDPLWQRIYNTKANRCQLIYALNYNLIVVGHCVTGDATGSPTFADIYGRQSLVSREELAEAKRCQGIDGKGCVLLDCYSQKTLNPKLVFVDISSSEAFRSKENINRKRIVEMLHLVKVDREAYYKVTKLKLDPAASDMKSPVLAQMKHTATPATCRIGGKKRKNKTVKRRRRQWKQ